MAIMIIPTRIIQELNVHVTMAEKSRIMRASAVRMSSFEEGFMASFYFRRVKTERYSFQTTQKPLKSSWFGQPRTKLFSQDFCLQRYGIN
jgi:hypothetical protein